MQNGDRIQSQLSSYAAGLAYEQFDDDTVHSAKVRVIDTFGALIGGFAGDPCRIARDVAVQMPNPNGSTVIGTDIRTAPDLAAFANGTTARTIRPRLPTRRPQCSRMFRWSTISTVSRCWPGAGPPQKTCYATRATQLFRNNARAQRRRKLGAMATSVSTTYYTLGEGCRAGIEPATAVRIDIDI